MYALTPNPAPLTSMAQAIDSVRAVMPEKGYSLATAVGIYQLWSDYLPDYGTVRTWGEMAELASVGRSTAVKYGQLLCRAGLLIYQQLRPGARMLPNWYQIVPIVSQPEPSTKQTQVIQYPNGQRPLNERPASDSQTGSVQQTDAYVVVDVDTTHTEETETSNTELLSRLRRVGVHTSVAKTLLAQHPHDLLTAWCHEAETNAAQYKVDNLPGLIVSRVKSGDWPAKPPPNDLLSTGEQYVTGKYAKYISH